MAKRLIVHVGPGRTGSTSIQQMLYMRRGWLRARVRLAKEIAAVDAERSVVSAEGIASPNIGRRVADRLAALDRRPPSFLIIGAQRSGTTFLHNRLARHPKIGKSLRKEVRYFDFRYLDGRCWYLAHFPWRTACAMTGEASPYYMVHPLAPDRVRDFDPQMKLIVVLCDPADRALSQWRHAFRNGIEWLTFEQALAAEPKRIAAERALLTRPPLHYSLNHPGSLSAFDAVNGAPVTIVFGTFNYRETLRCWIELAVGGACDHWRIVCMDEELVRWMQWGERLRRAGGLLLRRAARRTEIRLRQPEALSADA